MIVILVRYEKNLNATMFNDGACCCRNGTGTGGNAEELGKKLCDFEHAVESKLFFQHGEASKQFVIRINPDCEVYMSFLSPKRTTFHGIKIGLYLIIFMSFLQIRNINTV